MAANAVVVGLSMAAVGLSGKLYQYFLEFFPAYFYL